ncbi:MAG TPA: CDP-alcohol phosphatidyltransferase family protein [Longimicrobiaceae bacterium]|nr:CDP-alcohol phosphatidyltransferase family protein [Longimicrobiaceae bacterium]
MKVPALLPEWLRTGFVRSIRPLMDGLVRRRVHPNVITTAGFLVTVGAGACFFAGHLGWGGVLILLGGVFDILDGYVARGTGLASAFGSFYDSTLDRISEIVVFLGLFSLYGGGHPDLGEPWMVYVVALALGGSLMVSYTRARAEALGIDCKVGMMQRPERVVLLGVAAMLGTRWDGVVLTWVLVAMAALTNLTAFQRIVWVYRHTRAGRAGPTLPTDFTPTPSNEAEATT